MDHRRFLGRPEAHHPFAGTDVLARAGGRPAVAALVGGLYDRIEADPVLRPLFGGDLAKEREAQKRFFTEWLGGDAIYSERAYTPLAHRHALLPITRALAGRWLAAFAAALQVAVAEEGLREEIYGQVRLFATALVNEAGPPSALRAHPHGICLRYRPAVESLALAQRGDAVALRRLLARDPDVLASAQHAASLLHLAVLGGRRATVELLLASGVDVNKPASMTPAAPLVLVSPLCAARVRRRAPIEALLLEHGAAEDIFTYAYLGDLARLEADLAGDTAQAQASDPAVDALEVTPVHHAVAGGQVEALRALLGCLTAGTPIRGGERALREAAARASVPLVAALLERGVRASSIGAGRWVLHAELASRLSRAGAVVDRSGSWIGLSCTGNQGRKDDPDFVAALLRHGARVTDRRLVGQDADSGRATALHYAAKAGFGRTVALLLDGGADPTARDDNGRTPLDWLDRAARSVDKAALRRLLERRRLNS